MVAQLFDIGTVFRVQITTDGAPVNLASLTALTFYFRKPDNVLIARTGVLSTDGTDGQVQYTSESGDLDQAGRWLLQVLASNEVDQTWRTRVFSFDVLENI